MPVYRYSCCGEELELLRGLNIDDPLCPNCGAKMQKLLTHPAKIEVKGTHSKGYKEGYAEDYRRRLQEKRS